MKIAVIGTRGFPNIQGGVETHCENLYPRLVQRGCRIIVFTRKPYVDPGLRAYQGVEMIPLPCPRNKYLEAFFHTFLGIFFAKRIRAEILHFHAIGPSLLIPLARLLGLKVVMTNHGADYKRKKWPRPAKVVLKIGECLGSVLSNQVICISEFIAEGIQKKFRREPIVIPNGVVIPHLIKEDTNIKNYGLKSEEYILAVGRLVPEKGFHDLINAFSSISNLPWKLVITGAADHDDAYSAKLKQQAGCHNNIILTGHLKTKVLCELYSHAGLFIIPSYYEGLSIALLEAMSYGLGCVASDIPANREVCLPEKRYFAPGDIDDMKKKIIEFVAKPLNEEEKKQQIDLLKKKYDWDKIAERTKEVYLKVIG